MLNQHFKNSDAAADATQVAAPENTDRATTPSPYALPKLKPTLFTQGETKLPTRHFFRILPPIQDSWFEHFYAINVYHAQFQGELTFDAYPTLLGKINKFIADNFGESKKSLDGKAYNALPESLKFLKPSPRVLFQVLPTKSQVIKPDGVTDLKVDKTLHVLVLPGQRNGSTYQGAGSKIISFQGEKDDEGKQRYKNLVNLTEGHIIQLDVEPKAGFPSYGVSVGREYPLAIKTPNGLEAISEEVDILLGTAKPIESIRTSATDAAVASMLQQVLDPVMLEAVNKAFKLDDYLPEPF